MQTKFTDILIIGAGGAGLRSAIAAKEESSELKVTLLTKGKIGRSGVTATACSDRMAFHAALDHTEPGGPDNWKYHAEDIYRIGGYVSDGDLAVILAKNAREAFEYLDRIGVPFVKRKDGLPDQFITDGSKYARACYTGPHTANHIEEALVREIRNSDIRIVEDCMLVDLLTSADGKEIVGGFVVENDDGSSGRPILVLYRAKSIVLATGGAGAVFKVNVFPNEMTGDGYAAAVRAGAELTNMEFIQIGLSSIKTKLACSGSMMRALPRLVNSRDKEFLPAYFPEGIGYREIYDILFAKGSSWPVSNEESSNIIDIAVFKELAAGRHVFLDYSRNPLGLNFGSLSRNIKSWYRDTKQIDLSQREYCLSPLRRLQAINPQAIEWLAERGIDLEKGDKIEIAPAIQHFQGGVKIGTRGETCIRGLYAAGEVAGGQHGANRPGGNALLDCQVFGKITGTEAARRARQCDIHALDESSVARYDELFTDIANGAGFASDAQGLLRIIPEATIPASEAREQIQKIMAESASVVRTEGKLNAAISTVERLRTDGLRVDERGVTFALETRNILDVSAAILHAAGIRTESRGPHLYFKDAQSNFPMPRKDPDWRKCIVIRLKDGKFHLEVRNPVDIKM